MLGQKSQEAPENMESKDSMGASVMDEEPEAPRAAGVHLLSQAVTSTHSS